MIKGNNDKDNLELRGPNHKSSYINSLSYAINTGIQALGGNNFAVFISGMISYEEYSELSQWNQS